MNHSLSLKAVVLFIGLIPGILFAQQPNIKSLNESLSKAENLSDTIKIRGNYAIKIFSKDQERGIKLLKENTSIETHGDEKLIKLKGDCFLALADIYKRIDLDTCLMYSDSAINILDKYKMRALTHAVSIKAEVLYRGKDEKEKACDLMKKAVAESQFVIDKMKLRGSWANYVKLDDPLEGIRIAKANTQLKSAPDTALFIQYKGMSYRLIAQCYESIDANKCLQYTDSAIQVLQSGTYKEALLDALTDKSSVLMTLGKTEESLRTYEYAFTKIDSTVSKSSINYIKGCYSNALLITGKIQESIKISEEVIEYYDQTKQYHNAIEGMRIMSGSYRGIDVYKAIAIIYEAIEYAKTHQLPAERNFSLYHSLGCYYEDLGDLENAKKYYRYSIDCSGKCNRFSTEALATSALACVLYKEKNIQESELLYKEAIELGKKVGYDSAIGEALLGLGRIYAEKKELAKAQTYMQNALTKFVGTNHEENIIETRIALANLLKDKRDFVHAKKHIDKALHSCNTIKSKIQLYKSYKLLSEIYDEENDTGQSLRYLKKSVLYKDSVFMDEKRTEINRMETKYETEKKEQQIQLLEANNQNQQLSLEKAEQERNMMFAGLGLLVLLTVPVGFYTRQRNKNKVLEARINSENKECTRIAKELHDSVSGSLTTIRYLLESGTEGNSLVENIESVSKEVRGISHKLNMSALANQGIKEAVYDALMLNQFPKDIQLAINMPEGFEVKDFEVKINFIRILQELVQNTIKYAEASSVEISFEQEKQSIVLTYQDNGKGCDMEQISLGNGLRNIKDRVKYIKGTLEFDSQPDNGFYCCIKI
ncbi:ATP-binding protein [Marinifilum flexuosum]|uniref:ATP-binding protein n=1 Tax=Marinifilum flexuosum TaxID=1117708 RepID=UPI002494D57A|nr:ATP-binding protein [Marinifilum flexuosum]